MAKIFKKRKVVLLIAVLVMLLSVVGCQSKTGTKNESDKQTTQKQEENKQLEPGLYKSDGTFVSWKELTSLEYCTVEWHKSLGGSILERPILYVEDGVLSAIPEEFTPVDFISYSLLEGKLVIDNSVSALEKGAFYKCLSLKEVVLPEGITEIPERAFRSCNNLIRIEIPDSVVSFGKYAFLSCGFTEFTVPNSVVTLGASCFGDCVQLTKFTFGNSVTNIGKQCLSGNNIETLIIPDSVEKIEEFAFLNSNSMKKIYIPSSVESIEQDILKWSDVQITVYTDAEEKPAGWDESFAVNGDVARPQPDHVVIWSATLKDFNQK